MKEAAFQSEFGKRNDVVGIFELKLAKTKRLPFSAIKEHQERALLQANSGAGLYHKISDAPFFKDEKKRMRFTKPKPFDCMFLKNIPAYVVVMFWESRKNKMVYYIHIENFLRMRDESTMKSFTEVEAEFYAEIMVDYTKKVE